MNLEANFQKKFSEEERLKFWKEMEERAAKRQDPKGEPHIIFRVDNKKFAIDASVLRGVIPWREPSILPFLPRHIKGVAFMRGRIISVTDLYALLGIERQKKPSFFVIVYKGEKETAIEVDQVDSVSPLETHDIPFMSDRYSGARIGLIKGQIDTNRGQILVLDHERCLTQRG